MSTDPAFWTATAGLLLTCLAAIGARAMAEFSPHELERICGRRNAPHRLSQILKRREPVTMAAETLRVLATAVFLGAGAVWLWDHHLETGSVSLASTIAGGDSGTRSTASGRDTWMSSTNTIRWSISRRGTLASQTTMGADSIVVGSSSCSMTWSSSGCFSTAGAATVSVDGVSTAGGESR